MSPLLICLLAIAGSAPESPAPSIERLDPGLDRLIAPDAKIEILDGGFLWSEGPVWKDNRLLFSDVPADTIYSWTDGADHAEIFLKPSGSGTACGQGSNGLALDRESRLILCRHGDRSVARIEKSGRLTKLVVRFEGKRFNSPNDLAISNSGAMYFTDPPYGLGKGVEPELPFHGVFRLHADGQLDLLIRDLKFPNGIALSPDEKILYVAVSDPSDTRIMAYDIHPDGKISGDRVFFSTASLPKRPGVCDGLKVDSSGNLWATGPGGVLVISPTGKHLGTILTGSAAANCGWGGPEKDTLYITAHKRLLRVKTLSKGL